jgi:hypothetical protein
LRVAASRQLRAITGTFGGRSVTKDLMRFDEWCVFALAASALGLVRELANRSSVICMLKLFGRARSRARRSLWMLEEIGVA